MHPTRARSCSRPSSPTSTTPAVVYEHRWRNGDLVVFDNLAMQHARSNVELNGPGRTLRKVMLPMPEDIAEMTKPTYATAKEG